MNRQQRRTAAARLRMLIQKRTPFGRVRVLSLEVGELPQDERVVYRHFTKGVVDRRTTMPLLNNLISVG